MPTRCMVDYVAQKNEQNLCAVLQRCRAGPAYGLGPCTLLQSVSKTCMLCCSIVNQHCPADNVGLCKLLK